MHLIIYSLWLRKRSSNPQRTTVQTSLPLGCICRTLERQPPNVEDGHESPLLADNACHVIKDIDKDLDKGILHHLPAREQPIRIFS